MNVAGTNAVQSVSKNVKISQVKMQYYGESNELKT